MTLAIEYTFRTFNVEYIYVQLGAVMLLKNINNSVNGQCIGFVKNGCCYGELCWRQIALK